MFIVFLLVYNIFLLCSLPLVITYYIIRVFKKKDNLSSFLQKFGLYFCTSSVKKYDIWFHAASVGEVKSLEFILKKYASKQILITTTTLKSKEVVDGYQNANIKHHFLPLDFPPFYLLFLFKNRCKTVVIAESEIWPNFYVLLRLFGKKVTMFNARASGGTQKKWLKFGNILRKILKTCSVIIAQSRNSYDFFQKFHHNVQYFGNLKFLNLNGMTKQDTKIITFCKEKSSIICVASTHEGEDLPIIKAISDYKGSIIYISRHPHRVHDIAKILQEYKITYEMYSKFTGKQVQCLLIDEIGLMLDCLSHSKITIFGGSFLPHLKGHNIMEAAQFGCKIITGRFVETFAEVINEMKEKQAIIQCDVENINSVITAALQNESLGKNAKTYVSDIKPDITKILAYFS